MIRNQLKSKLPKLNLFITNPDQANRWVRIKGLDRSKIKFIYGYQDYLYIPEVLKRSSFVYYTVPSFNKHPDYEKLSNCLRCHGTKLSDEQLEDYKCT